MVDLKAFFRKVLVVVSALILATATFYIGRATVSDGSMAAAYSDAAGFTKKGNPTFCELNEQARMFVCPAVRMCMTSKSGGSIIIYQCDSQAQEGYVEAINLSEEERVDMLQSVVDSGMQHKPHCSDSGVEVFRIYHVGGSDATLLRSI